MSNENNHKYFKLYAHCLPVKGASRAIICDLKRLPGYYLIPNSLYEVLLATRVTPYIDLVNSYSGDDRSTLNDYFEFLINHELGFWCDEQELNYFPDLPLDWDYPSDISNAILDIAEYSTHPYGKIFKELAELKCHNIQIRSYDVISLNRIRDVLQLTVGMPFFYIELLTKYDEETDSDQWSKLLEEFPALSKIIVHSTCRNKVIFEEESSSGSLFFINQSISSSSHCGYIHKDYFSSSIELFTESQSRNTCLNKKISIDVDGNIKNCPAMLRNYGNIRTQSLQETLAIDEFQQLWHINKDQIHICKDCEFRYICVDCRAFLQDPANSFSKPLKCGYNPYTEKWENWEKNELSQKAIAFYNERANF